MLPNDKTSHIPNANKPLTGVQLERGIIRHLATLPAHNNFTCSYEVVIESEIFKAEGGGRSAMIYFSAGTAFKPSTYEYGRFCFFLPKSLQPIFEEALGNKTLLLTIRLVVENNRPTKDQSEAEFHLQGRDQLK
ncbi:MAG: hypothetical protein LBV54_02310 [Puniceicoccales bacterium]|jgi:hypothetical protein|nr:hypothetical protein [Puniceicoccales bacterium]